MLTRDIPGCLWNAPVPSFVPHFGTGMALAVEGGMLSLILPFPLGQLGCVQHLTE